MKGDAVNDRNRGFSIPRTRAWGIGLALATAVISGFAIFVNGYGVRDWRAAGASTASYTTAKNLVAAVLLVGVIGLLSARRSGEGFTKPTSRGQWLGLAAIGLVGGSVPFLLFFEGLSRATSSQAAFLHKTLVLWVAVLAIPLLKERVGWPHLAAIGLLFGGQIVLAGGVTDLGAGAGEWMVLGATMLWAIEVIIAKRLLATMSGLTVGVARMALGGGLLVAYGVATGGFAELAALGAGQWGWVLLTGGVLGCYVGSWYLALARAQAVDVTAVLVFGSVITAMLNAGIQGTALAPQAVGLVLVTCGAAAMVAAALRYGGRDRALTR